VSIKGPVHLHLKDFVINAKKWIGRAQTQKDDLLDLLDGRPKRDPTIDLATPKVACGHGDGRWYVDPTSLGPRSVVYSVGVGYDISFDLAMMRRFGCEVQAFDPTTLAKVWLSRQRLPAGFRFHDVGLAHFDGEAVFSLPPRHSVSYTMKQVAHGTNEHRAQVRRLATLMADLGHPSLDVLKIDIEGAEFELIDDLVTLAPKIRQLLIEFHDRLADGSGRAHTAQAVERLKGAGFKLFHVSRRGYEYCFSRSASV
jgi:FkbM family methyltransferase